MPEDLTRQRGRGGLNSPRRKPTVAQLGIDVDALAWQRSGDGDGSFEVAMITEPGQADAWVLLRVAGDPSGRVLVYDRTEWECFLDGVARGEFDDAAELPAGHWQSHARGGRPASGAGRGRDGRPASGAGRSRDGMPEPGS
jgi:Domain of unknown function (DUF397)